MRFVIDEQLPRLLTGYLRVMDHESLHTFELGLRSKSDADLIELARSAGAAIITRDRQIATRSRSDGDPPVIWWRRGAEATPLILLRCKAELPGALRRLSEGETVVEIL